MRFAATNIVLGCLPPCITATRSAGAGEVSTLLYSLGALGFRPPAGWLSFLFRVTFPWLLLGSGSSVGTRTSNRQLLLNDQAQSSSNSSILGRGTLHRYV
jgi:hypothetical protein